MWPAPLDQSAFVQQEGEGDAVYAEETRRIADGVKFIEYLSQSISASSTLPRQTAARQLEKARDVAARTQQQLRDFEAFVTESGGGSQAQRVLMYRNLRERFRTSLRQLEAAAEASVISGDGAAYEDSLTPPLDSSSYNTSDPLAPHPRASESAAHGRWFDAAVPARPPPTPPPWNSKSAGTGFPPLLPPTHSRRESGSTTDTYSNFSIEDHRRRLITPLAQTTGTIDNQILREKRDNLQHLRREIQGIHDLYLEMNSVTQSQAAPLDMTEDRMANSVSSTARAAEQLALAREHQRAQWRRTILLSALIGLLLIFIIVFWRTV